MGQQTCAALSGFLYGSWDQIQVLKQWVPQVLDPPSHLPSPDCCFRQDGRGGGDIRTVTGRDPRKAPCWTSGSVLAQSGVGVGWGSEDQPGHCSVSLTSHLPPSFMPGEALASWDGRGPVGAALRRVDHEEFPGYPSVHKGRRGSPSRSFPLPALLQG